MGRGFAKPVGWVERPAYARYASFDGFKSAEARSAKAEAITRKEEPRVRKAQTSPCRRMSKNLALATSQTPISPNRARAVR